MSKCSQMLKNHPNVISYINNPPVHFYLNLNPVEFMGVRTRTPNLSARAELVCKKMFERCCTIMLDAPANTP